MPSSFNGHPKKDHPVAQTHNGRGGWKASKLQTAWQQASRGAKRVAVTLAAALTLTASFNSAAEAMPHHPAHLVTQHHKTHAPVPYTRSAARLKKIEAAMAQTETGKALVTFAAQQNINIRLATDAEMGNNKKKKTTYKGLNFGSRILLNENSTDDDIMLTLAHELRHSWHKRVAKVDDLALEPKREWIRDRVEEADAFSFEINFAYEYEKATGRRLNLGNRKNACGPGGDGYLCLLVNHAAARDAGLPPVAAYEKLLKNAFAHTHGLGYDADFLKTQGKEWDSIVKAPATGADEREALEQPISPEDFAIAIKHIVTLGLRPDIDVSAFANWTVADITDLDKTGGMAKDDMAKLKADEDKYAAAQAAYKKFEGENVLPLIPLQTVPLLLPEVKAPVFNFVPLKPIPQKRAP